MSSHSPAMGPVAADNSWRRHIRSTINLGIPFVGAQLAQMAINTTDVIMDGWLGTTELAAIVLASQIFFIVFISSIFIITIIIITYILHGYTSSMFHCSSCTWSR